MNIFHLKEKTIELTKEINDLQSKLSKTIKNLQNNCNHPYENLIQSPYRSGTFFNFEEVRLCTMCGLSETRPCTGWKQLVNSTGEYGNGKPIPEVTSDELYNISYKIFD